jgi:hypothetical protein
MLSVNIYRPIRIILLVSDGGNESAFIYSYRGKAIRHIHKKWRKISRQNARKWLYVGGQPEIDVSLPYLFKGTVWQDWIYMRVVLFIRP